MVVGLIIGGGAALIAGGVTTTVVLIGAGAGAIALSTGVEEEVQDWIVGEVIQPVANAIGDTIDYIADNPIEAIVTLGTTIFAPYAAPLLGTTTAALTSAATWAIPLANGAQTLVDGGSFEDALQDAALSYVAQSVGGTIGDFSSKQATRLITNTLGDTAVTNTVASVIGAGSKAASTAIVYGQNPVEAFKYGSINAAVGATLGYIDNQITEITGGQTGFEDLQDGIKNTIYSGIAAEVTGTDFTALDAITALDSDGYVSKIIDKYSNLGTWMSDFAKANTDLTDAELTLIGDAVGRAATIALNGNPDMSGEEFFAALQEPAYEEFKDLINDPLEGALDRISGTFAATEAAAAPLNQKLLQAEGYATTIKNANARIETILGGQNDLIEQYNTALARFNADKTQANADAVDGLVKKIETYVANNQEELNTLSKRITDTRPLYDAAASEIAELQADYDRAAGFMVTDLEDFSDEIKPVLEGAERVTALSVSGGIDEAAYREKYGLSADENVYQHYLARGIGLPTVQADLDQAMESLHLNLAQEMVRANGAHWNLLNPTQQAAALEYISEEVPDFSTFSGDKFSSLAEGVLTTVKNAADDPVISFDLDSGTSMQDVIDGTARLQNVGGGEYKWSTDEYQKFLVEMPESPFVTTNTVIDDAVNKRLTDAGLPAGLVGETLTDQAVAVLNGQVSDFDFTNYIQNVLATDELREDYQKRTSPTLYDMVTSGNWKWLEGSRFSGAVDEGNPTFGDSPIFATELSAVEGTVPAWIPTLMELDRDAGKKFDDSLGAKLWEGLTSIAATYGYVPKAGGYEQFREMTDAVGNIVSVVTGATGETLSAIAGLATAKGESPDGFVNDIADFLIQLSGDVKSDSWTENAAIMEARSNNYLAEWYENNPGKEPTRTEKARLKATAIYGNLQEYPVQWLAENVGGELIQEIPILIASGGLANVTKAVLLNSGEAFAKKVATRVGVGSALALDAAEAFGGTANGAYNEAYETAIAMGMTQDKANAYAIDVAQKAGTIALTTLLVTAGVGGQALAKSVLGDKATPEIIDSFNEVARRIKEGGTVTIKEGVTESIEEALPQLYVATTLAQIDPSYDVVGEVTAAAVIGKLAGAGTAAGIYSGSTIADALMTMSPDVQDAVQNSNNAAEARSALQNLGIEDTVVLDNLMNAGYDDLYVSTGEAAAAFNTANPDYVPTDEEIGSFIGERADADVAAEVASYVDPRFLDIDEVKAAAAAEGITLTDEQAQAYVGQKDEADAIAEIAAEYDPQYTSASEAISMFRDLGYRTSPFGAGWANSIKNRNWRNALALQFQGMTEAEAREAIEAYVDPRQVTTEEAKALFEDLGYTPSNADLAEIVGQSYTDDTFDATAPDRVESYVDPRQVTEEEAREFFTSLGYEPTDEEVAEFTAQVAETDQKTAVESYVDPRFVTLDEVQAVADEEGLTLTEALAATYLGQKDEESTLEAARGEFDPLATTFDEAKQFFDDLGYTPTTAEVADFVASATEEAQQSGVAEYVDPRQVTEDESKAFLEALGYTPTDEEVASFVGQLNDATYQTSQETAVGEYVDPRQVTAEEAKQFFEDLGYTPTEEQIAEFTAQVAETTQSENIAKYVDPRQVTMAEVQEIADQEGLTLTEALAATYIGQSEADTFQQEQLDAARAEYDPLATTLEEATQFFADTGYNATTEEIAEFVASKTEEAQTSAIGAYVDPRQVTAAEAEEFLTSIGYQPTQEEIDSFVGQVNDENYQVTQKAKIDEYTDPRMFDAGEVRAAYEELGLVDVTQEDVDRFVGQYDPTSEDYSGEGFEAYQRAQLEEYMPAATFNVIKQVLGSPAVEDNPDTPEDESKEATGIYAEFEAGATRDEALDAAIQKVAEDLGTTKTDLLDELGLTEERLGSEIDALAEDIGGIEEDIGGIEEDITGITEDIGGIEEDIGGIEEDIGGISDILGKPAVEDDPDTEADESQDATGLFATIKAYEDAGIERDEALELAIGEVASALGTTETNLLDAIGTSKTDILGELETGLDTLGATLSGDIDNIAGIIGKPAKDVSQVDIDFIADVIAQNQVLDELQMAQYDVTGDGIVDINDQNLLNSALQGEDVTFADTSMFGPATGLYGVIGDVQQDVQSQIDQQTDTITDLVTDLNTQINTESKRRNLSDLTQMLMSAEDLGGQRVSVRTPDPVRLNYLYDFNSIFANPSQASLFASPFGGTRAQPANAPRAPMGAGLMNTGPMGPMGMAAGFAEGGAVDETDELLRILGEME